MYQISKNDKLKIMNLLVEPLQRVHLGLLHLYPDTDSRIREGHERLYLLSPRFKLWNSKKDEYYNEHVPIPHGNLVRKEWLYLEGEYEGWNWAEVATESNGGEFPKRRPPFPIKYWPHSRLPPPDYLRTDLNWGQYSFNCFEYSRLAARASWILFISDIPFSLWGDILAQLITHDLRLLKLSKLYRTLLEVEEFVEVVPKCKMLNTCLELLYYTQPNDKIIDTKEWRIHIEKILFVLDTDTQYEDESYKQKTISNLLDNWRKLDGPTKISNKASYYVAPIAKDLYKLITTSLSKMLQNKTLKISYSDKPIWFDELERNYFYSEGIDSRIIRTQIHCIIYDLVRFCFKWDKFKILGSGIELPLWGGDNRWKALNLEEKEILVEAGKEGRLKLSKRVQQWLNK